MTKKFNVTEYARETQTNPKPWDAIQMRSQRQLLSPLATLTASISR